MQELRRHNIKTMVIEPGFVATDMTVRQEGVVPERMIRPEDVASAALLPFEMKGEGVPVEVVLKLALSAHES
jgi:NAD(P)-dependent dehydrogenase (short-subunit alcohol dehydrogenase family)